MTLADELDMNRDRTHPKIDFRSDHSGDVTGDSETILHLSATLQSIRGFVYVVSH